MAERKVIVLTGADGNDYDIRDEELHQGIGSIPPGNTVEGQISTLESGKVPTTRKVNNKDLSSDITLVGTDIPVSSSDNTKVDSALANKVPTTRKVNNKALSSDVNLVGSDIPVSALDSTKLDVAITDLKSAFIQFEKGTTRELLYPQFAVGGYSSSGYITDNTTRAHMLTYLKQGDTVIFDPSVIHIQYTLVGVNDLSYIYTDGTFHTEGKIIINANGNTNYRIILLAKNPAGTDVDVNAFNANVKIYPQNGIRSVLDPLNFNSKQFIVPTYEVVNKNEYSTWISPSEYNETFDVNNYLVVRQFENLTETRGIVVFGRYIENNTSVYDRLLEIEDTNYHIIQVTRNYKDIYISNGQSVVSPISRKFVFGAYPYADIPKEVLDSVSLNVIPEVKSPLKGLKFNCIGDSFTESLNYWGNFIASRAGCTMVNKGVSGSRISTDWVNDGVLIKSFINRVDTLDTTANATIIFGGINDTEAIYLGDITLGNINSEPGTTTFYGALKKLIIDIKAIGPARRIFGVVPPDFNPNAPRAQYMAPVQQACRDVFEYFAIPYADLKLKCQEMFIDDFNVQTFRLGTSDYHPSYSGYGRISNVIQGMLEQYYQNTYS